MQVEIFHCKSHSHVLCNVLLKNQTQKEKMVPGEYHGLFVGEAATMVKREETVPGETQTDGYEYMKTMEQVTFLSQEISGKLAEVAAQQVSKSKKQTPLSLATNS